MALELDGVDQAIDCDTKAVLENLAQKTIMAWLNTDVEAEQRVMEKSDGGGWRFSVEDNVSELRVLFNQQFSDANGRWRTDNTTIVRNTWYHVAITYDRTNVANDPIIYRNGTSINVVESNAPVGTADDNSGNSMYIGKKEDSTLYFDGTLDDIRIYDRLLSAEEILTIYTARATDNIVYGLVGRWMPNELAPGATVLSVIDLSPTGVSPGTPENAPVYAEGILGSRHRIA